MKADTGQEGEEGQRVCRELVEVTGDRGCRKVKYESGHRARG